MEGVSVLGRDLELDVFPTQTFVLVSARTGLFFFIAPGIMLCFGFSRKIMLIAH